MTFPTGKQFEIGTGDQSLDAVVNFVRIARVIHHRGDDELPHVGVNAFRVARGSPASNLPGGRVSNSRSPRASPSPEPFSLAQVNAVVLWAKPHASITSKASCGHQSTIHINSTQSGAASSLMDSYLICSARVRSVM